MKLYKRVLFPIVIPAGKYCADADVICYHLDYHPDGKRCDLGFDIESDSVNKHEKPHECLCLEEDKM